MASLPILFLLILNQSLVWISNCQNSWTQEYSNGTDGTQLLIHQPTLPYTRIDSRLRQPFTLRLSINIPVLTLETFDITFASTSNFPSFQVPFNLKINIYAKLLIRKSFENGHLLPTVDELPLLNGFTVWNFPLQFGVPFVLELRDNKKEVEGWVDGQQVFVFAHKKNASAIDWVEVHGPGMVDWMGVKFE